MKRIYLSLNLFFFMVSAMLSAQSQPRDEMRKLVIEISQYARQRVRHFIVIPQNGQELVTLNGEADGELALDYLNAVDGTGREDLFYGYSRDNRLTRDNDRLYLEAFCDTWLNQGKVVLTTDYCSDEDKMMNSYRLNQAKGYISFAADERDLNRIPEYPETPFQVNNDVIESLSNAENFLYLLDSGRFDNKEDFLDALKSTDYDLIIMDPFHNDEPFSFEEIVSLREKSSGGSRLLIAYFSIGEAEDYRYYWNPAWNRNPPNWVEAENPHWKGNYKVRYWDPDWKGILMGSPNSFLDRILSAGFDGVYLDIIDAYEFFE